MAFFEVLLENILQILKSLFQIKIIAYLTKKLNYIKKELKKIFYFSTKNLPKIF